jgi:hypothetical protein
MGGSKVRKAVDVGRYRIRPIAFRDSMLFGVRVPAERTAASSEMENLGFVGHQTHVSDPPRYAMKMRRTDAALKLVMKESVLSSDEAF